MRHATCAPIYQEDSDLLTCGSVKYSAGYGRHEIEDCKKELVKHKKKLTYITIVLFFLVVGYIIHKGAQHPSYVFVCMIAMCPGFMLTFQWNMQKGGKQGHITDLMQCFIHGLLACSPVALTFIFLPGYLHKNINLNSQDDVQVWKNLCDNFVSFVIITAIYEEIMKTLFTHFYYRGHQNAVHWRCLAFSFACSFYEIFEAHVASRKVNVRVDRLILDVSISWMERLITSHFNAFMINKPKFVKNVLLTTIPTRVLGITVRACIMLCACPVEELYVLMITLVFLYISPIPTEFDGKNSYELINYKGWCKRFENVTKKSEKKQFLM